MINKILKNIVLHSIMRKGAIWCCGANLYVYNQENASVSFTLI